MGLNGGVKGLNLPEMGVTRLGESGDIDAGTGFGYPNLRAKVMLKVSEH